MCLWWVTKPKLQNFFAAKSIPKDRAKHIERNIGYLPAISTLDSAIVSIDPATHLAGAVDDTNAMESAALDAVADQESIGVRQRNGVPRIAHVVRELERSQARLSVTREHLDEPRSTARDVNIAT